MLLSGINHVALLTADTDRLCAFYRDMFDAVVDGQLRPGEGMRLTFLKVGETAELNVFEVEGTPRRSARRRCSVEAASTTSGSRHRRSRPSTRPVAG